MNAASTVTPTPSRSYSGEEHDPLRAEPIRPSGDAGDGWGRAAAYDAYADGLHTYAIWSLRDHDAAVDALYCAFVMADRHATQVRQPEHVHPWLYALIRHECHLRADATSTAPAPVSGRLRPPTGAADPDGSLAALERSLRRAEFHSLEWPESEGLAPAHKEILELTIRHGLDSQGLGLVLGLGRPGRGGGSPGRNAGSRSAESRSAARTTAPSTGATAGLVGSAGSQGFGILADAWRELERSLAAVAVAKGSREHCAQLAELTFGWSGRLTATLRAPLTDHVDGCTRCQHYLHTVIGTPAAPTILPFVAAPRALREILLGELHDPHAARAEGVDHAAIAGRLSRFTADGFPASEALPPLRRRGTRRTPDRPPPDGTLPRRTPGANLPSTAGAGKAAAAAAAEASVGTGSAARLRPVASKAEAGAADDSMYCAPGSWAARVLPPRDDAEFVRPWRPMGSGTATGAASPSGRRSASATRYGSGTPTGSGARPRPTFVATPSGRFAAYSPGDGPAPGSAAAVPPRHFAAPAAEPPRGPDGKPRARHKSRPVRQAVTSAVALGAVGVVAAGAAALLGLTSEGHGQSMLGDPGLPLPTGPGTDLGRLSVTVSTDPAAAPTSSPVAQVAPARPPGAVVPAAGNGNPGSGAPSTSSTGSGQPTANPADFHVSVNQRSADPNNIVILLRNTGATPISWTAAAQDSWIDLSQSSGTLGAGQSQDITATASSAAPAGQWTSRVAFAPGGTVLTIRGGTATTPPPSSSPPPSASPSSPPPPPSSSPPAPPASGSPKPTGPQSSTAAGASSAAGSSSASASGATTGGSSVRGAHRK